MERELLALVIGKSSDLAVSFRDICREITGYQVNIESATASEAWDKVPQLKPDLVILNVDDNEEESLKLGLFVSRDHQNCFLVFSASEATADLILKSVRTGAKDFLRQPFTKEEVQALLNKIPEKKTDDGSSVRDSKVISIFSNKGGVGTTTIACNLGVELAKKNPNLRIALADLVLQHGDVSVFLDVQSTYTITNVIENIHRLDKSLLMSTLSKHESGLSVLPGPNQAEEADFISAEQIRQVFDLLKENFDYIIVDAGHEFNDHVISVLDMSDYILLTTSLDLPTIRNTKRAIDIMNRLRYDKEKIKIIVSRYDAKGHLTIEDVEKNLGCPVMHCLANDYLTVISAINSGQPVAKISSKTRIAKGFEELEDLAVNHFVKKVKDKDDGKSQSGFLSGILNKKQ